MPGGTKFAPYELALTPSNHGRLGYPANSNIYVGMTVENSPIDVHFRGAPRK